jgi:hypothetical protein
MASGRFRFTTSWTPPRAASVHDSLRDREEDRRDAGRRRAREGVRAQRRARKLFKSIQVRKAVSGERKVRWDA